MPEFAGLRLALTTFTIFPVAGARLDRRTAGRAMEWGPVVGAVLAAIASLAVVAMRYLSPSPGIHRLLPAVAGIGLMAVLTRGLHLDGLADTADALGVPDRERSLAVMKQSDIGAFGVVVLILVLLAQVTALTGADVFQHGTRALVCAVVAGRIAIMWACRAGVPAARPDGLGALVAGTVPLAAPMLWSLSAVAAGSAWAFVDDRGRWAQAIVQATAIIVALGAGGVAQSRLVRRFGGITGDMLGAVCEIATTVALVVAAAEPPDFLYRWG
jgi:adenosylcobinamide-GDP ribazoletransferase